jgi:hypothetical protein
MGACPKAAQYGPGPPSDCQPPSDPNNKPVHPMEKWLTKQVFGDLFPKSNLGWGPAACLPYNYDAFILAAR